MKPEIIILERKKRNMQNWTINSNGTISTRAIFGLKTKLNGWYLRKVHKPIYSTQNFKVGADKVEFWKEKETYWFKLGGRITNLDGFAMDISFMADFEKGDEKLVCIANIEITDVAQNGDAQWKTDITFLDNEEPEPEPEPEPIKPKSRKLLLTFDKGMWLIAILQSLLFWKKFWKIPTHVRIGDKKSEFDLSAESKGVKLINRKEQDRKVRSFKRFEITVTAEEFTTYSEMVKDLIGKKYDYFFYFRWALNTYLLPNILLAVFGLLSGNIWVDWLLLVLYIPINFGLYFLSKGKWACSEAVSYLLRNSLKLDFGYSDKYYRSSPEDMLQKILFLKQAGSRKIKEV